MEIAGGRLSSWLANEWRPGLLKREEAEMSPTGVLIYPDFIGQLPATVQSEELVVPSRDGVMPDRQEG